MLLTVEKFRHLRDFSGKCKYRKDGRDKKPGVYIWGFKVSDKEMVSENDFFPYYVGKHRTDVWARVSENVSELFGGNKASIFDIQGCIQQQTKIGTVHRDYAKASSAAKPKCGPNLPVGNYPNMLYFPEGLHRIVDFRTNKKLRTQLDWMEERFVVAVLSPVISSSTNVDMLEKCIGNLIGYDRLITKPYGQVNCNLKVQGVNRNLANFGDLFALLL